MIGEGSGNWTRSNRKTTVEDRLSLDISQLYKDGALVAGAYGNYSWLDSVIAERLAAISFLVVAIGESLFLEVDYCLNNAEPISHSIHLQQTFPHFGGKRYWFTCSCGRRVTKLYLQSRELACRNCLDLTYNSCQRSGQLERLMKQAGVDVDNSFEELLATLH